MKSSKIIFSLSIVALIFLTSCYKFNHNYIMKGKWYVNKFEINGGSSNIMEGVLPDYKDGKGQYLVYMLDNGIMRGEYYAHDTLVYFRTGTWDMPDKDHVEFVIDKFINGVFLIEQVDKVTFLLTTESNDIEFFDLGKVATVMRISRGEYVDPETTIP